MCFTDRFSKCLCKTTALGRASCELAFVNGRCPNSAQGSSGASGNEATLGAAVGCALLVIIVIVVAVLLVRRSHRQARPGEVSAVTMARFRNRRAHAEPDEWEIERELLIFTDRKLGSGHFGHVAFAALQDPVTGKGREVAVKQVVNAHEGSKEEREFVQEMSLMKALAGKKEAGKPAPKPYPFVVGLLGVCTLNEPLLLVLDYADQGDLAHYLRDQKPKRGARATLADLKMLLTFAAQCACGMDFLERHRVGFFFGGGEGGRKRRAEAGGPRREGPRREGRGGRQSQVGLVELACARVPLTISSIIVRWCTAIWRRATCLSTARSGQCAAFPTLACRATWRRKTTTSTSCPTTMASCR